MPKVRKLSVDEVRTLENRGKGTRTIIAEEYDTFLSEYTVGDYGEAELNAEEKRLTVRNRLKAAADRRGLDITFFRTRGSTIPFKIVAGAAKVAPKVTEIAIPAAPAVVEGKPIRKKPSPPRKRKG